MPWIYAAAQVCGGTLYRHSWWFETKETVEAEIAQMARSMHRGAMCGYVFVLRQWVHHEEGGGHVAARVVQRPSVEIPVKRGSGHVKGFTSRFLAGMIAQAKGTVHELPPSFSS